MSISRSRSARFETSQNRPCNAAAGSVGASPSAAAGHSTGTAALAASDKSDRRRAGLARTSAPSNRARTTPKPSSRSSSLALASSTRIARACPAWAAASTKRVLPAPAGPSTTSNAPAPEPARSDRRSISASSTSRSNSPDESDTPRVTARIAKSDLFVLSPPSLDASVRRRKRLEGGLHCELPPRGERSGHDGRKQSADHARTRDGRRSDPRQHRTRGRKPPALLGLARTQRGAAPRHCRARSTGRAAATKHNHEGATMRPTSRKALALASAGATLALAAGVALATPPNGETPTPLARGALIAPANINTKVIGGRVRIKTQGALDAMMAQITLAPGGTGGWHSHAGPLITIVTQGTLTIIDEIGRA